MTSSFEASVSRETMDRLAALHDLVKLWNPKINLISKSTTTDLWQRHIWDSLQLYQIAPPKWDRWVDLGSGGGFPGLIIAIQARETNTTAQLHLVESDARKCAFLRTVTRELNLNVTVHNTRIEDLPNLEGDIVSARALAPLPKLLSYVAMHQKTGISILPKGQQWKSELEDAQRTWHFKYTVHESITNPGSVILQIGDLTHV